MRPALRGSAHAKAYGIAVQRPVQRQMLPWKRSSTCCALGLAVLARRPNIDMTIPGLQYPHRKRGGLGLHHYGVVGSDLVEMRILRRNYSTKVATTVT